LDRALAGAILNLALTRADAAKLNKALLFHNVRLKENPMKRGLLLILAGLMTLSLLTGCNTVRGVGQDIEEGGEAIQKSST
jgi:entericidin B